jgi:hypothetical protein
MSPTNGSFAIWQDGVLIMNIDHGLDTYNGFERTQDNPSGYMVMENGFYTGATTATQLMYWDDFKVSDVRLGPGTSPTPTPTPTPTPQNNPVAWWKLDESSGAAAADSSGNANTGTLTNGPIWTTGKLGSALSFDGVNDYVTVPSSSSLDITGSFTLSAWTRFTNTTNYGFIVSKSEGGANGYELFRDTGNGRLRFSIGNASGSTVDPYFDIATPSGYNDGQWHHVAAVYGKGVKARMSVDGVNVVTSGNNPSAAVGLTTSNLLIGSRGLGGGIPFQGDIDDIRIYNRALAQSEIQTLANPVTPDSTPPSTPTNLTATAISSSQINLSWTASTDNVAVTGYKVFRNGTQIATPSTTSYTLRGRR